MGKEEWDVDLRSRKTGHAIKTIFSGEHDAACEFIDEWYKNNDIPGYEDGMMFEQLIDGSEGVFADLFLIDIPTDIPLMNETQEKIYDLLESYLEYCKTNGYTEFEVWCEDNIDTIDEDALVQDICQEVNHIADKLFK